MEEKTGALNVNIKQANGYRSNSSDQDTPTTPGSTLAVRFFIGQHAHDEDAASAQSLDAGSYRSTEAVTVQSSEQQQKQRKKLHLQTADAIDGNNTTGTFTTLMQLSAPNSQEWSTQSNSSRLASACSSPTLYGPQATTRKSKSKSWRKARGNSPPAEDLHIPPPPPLPPQPLTTASSSASLLSLRSNKIKRNSAVATPTTATPHIEEGGISAKSSDGVAASFSKANRNALSLANSSLMFELTSNEILNSLNSINRRKRQTFDSNFNRNELSETLQTIDINAILGGSTQHVNTECDDPPIACDTSSPFRTVTGYCNNLRNPNWGKSLTTFSRLLPSQYDDGISKVRQLSINGSPLPNPRTVSTVIHPDISNLHTRYSLMVMQFAQFLDHDLTMTPRASVTAKAQTAGKSP